MQGSRASPSHRTHTNHPPSSFQHWHYRLDGNVLFCLCLTIPYHHSAAAGESWRRISKRCHCKTVYITIKYKGTAIVWQHWHEEEDKDVDDDGPVYVMNQKTAIGHGIARVSGCLSQNIRVRGLPSGLPLHLRLLHQVLGKVGMFLKNSGNLLHYSSTSPCSVWRVFYKQRI